MRLSFFHRPILPFLAKGGLFGAIVHVLIFYGGMLILFSALDIDEVPLALYFPLLSTLFLIPLFLLLTMTYTRPAPRIHRIMLMAGSISFSAFLALLIAFMFVPWLDDSLYFDWIVILVLFVALILLLGAYFLARKPSLLVLICGSSIIAILFVFIPLILRSYWSSSVALELFVMLLMTGHGVWISIAGALSIRPPLQIQKGIGASGIVAGSTWTFLLLGAFVSSVNRDLRFTNLQIPEPIFLAVGLLFLIAYPIWLLRVSWWLFQNQREI